MFNSEKNKQHEKVLCNKFRRLPNETIKQLAVRIKTLVRKAYSLNTQQNSQIMFGTLNSLIHYF